VEKRRSARQGGVPTPANRLLRAARTDHGTLHRTGRWEGELLHTKRDGTQVIVASRWSLRRTDSGYVLGTLETNNNITDRKRAEDGLRRTQETSLAEAQQLSHTGSVGWHVPSGEIFWSEESLRIFGHDRSIKPTLPLILQRIHPEDIALVQQVIDRAGHDKQEFDLEHRLMVPDGSVKHLHVVLHAVRDEPGSFPCPRFGSRQVETPYDRSGSGVNKHRSGTPTQMTAML